jgi:RimJ/RimL family protein N-acetyltransferase
MEFETERLILCPRTMNDFDACLAMDRMPGVVDFVVGPWANIDEHKCFIKSRITQDYGTGLGYWSIFAKARPDHFIGWVLLIPEDAIGPDIEIGWRLHPDHWRKGYAFEAANVLVDHAFAALDLPAILAGIDERNIASRKLAEKLGMQETGVSDGYVVYAVTSEDYAKRNRGAGSGQA